MTCVKIIYRTRYYNVLLEFNAMIHLTNYSAGSSVLQELGRLKTSLRYQNQNLSTYHIYLGT